MTSSETVLSHATAVYERVRRDIVRAAFLPGEKLVLAPLCARYAVGLTPLREALNRLSRDGLVVHSEQRGFQVAPFSADDLDELTRTRNWLNEVGLRESMARGDAAWEEQVILAYYRLSKLERYEPDGDRVSEAWERAHRAFHASLIAGCDSTWMIRYCDQLFDAAERYRNLSRLGRTRTPRDNDDEHLAIKDAVVARDSARAIALLTAHFDRTAQRVRDRLGASLDNDVGRRA